MIAWASDYGISLGQVATEEKSNEITAIPQLLDLIDVEDAIVTIDAAGCQKAIAAKIVDGKGDFVLSLKGNREKLFKDVQFAMLCHMQDDFVGSPVSRHVEFREDESRVRERTFTDNLSWLQRMTLSLIKQHSGKESNIMKRRMAGWSVDYLIQILNRKMHLVCAGPAPTPGQTHGVGFRGDREWITDVENPRGRSTRGWDLVR